jgi:probable F420-dependent oxidoreductase
LAVGDIGEATEAAAELEALGFSSLWMNPDPVVQRGEAFARVTKKMVFASSVASIWMYEPKAIAAAFLELSDRHPGRFLLGVGASHQPIVEITAPGRTYAKPVSAMLSWLDEMDALARPVPAEARIIAAIWPRMLGVARERSAGSHPYLVPAAHSKAARAILGDGPLLAPAHCVVLESDPAKARAIARAHLGTPYITLPNYANAWLAHGFEARDLENGGSDQLVDALVAWGGPDAIADKIGAHLEAGADHVAVQVLPEDGTFPRQAWRTLGAVLARL